MTTATVPRSRRTRFDDLHTDAWTRATADSFENEWGMQTRLDDGIVAANATTRTYTANRLTWRRWTTEHTVNALTLRREAEDAMPKTVMRDVTYSGVPVAPSPRQPATGEVGIAALNMELSRLAADMASIASPSDPVVTEWAQRYANLRTAVVRLREQFEQAEGAFEVVQIGLRRHLE